MLFGIINHKKNDLKLKWLRWASDIYRFFPIKLYAGAKLVVSKDLINIAIHFTWKKLASILNFTFHTLHWYLQSKLLGSLKFLNHAHAFKILSFVVLTVVRHNCNITWFCFGRLYLLLISFPDFRLADPNALHVSFSGTTYNRYRLLLTLQWFAIDIILARSRAPLPLCPILGVI